MANAADRKSIRAAEKSAKLADANRRAVLVGIMSTVQGREWIWSQLERRSIFSTTYDDNPSRMAFLEGQRSAGLELLADILGACPEEFTLAMREHNERRTESNARADINASAFGERSNGEDTRWDDQGPSDSDADARASEDA